jgi:hypothetical protein
MVNRGSANAQLVLKSPPNWEPPNQLSDPTATVITLRLSVSEMTRLQKILKLRGQVSRSHKIGLLLTGFQAAKLVVRAKPTKQSFSLHPTQLGQSNPPAPPPLQVCLSFYCRHGADLRQAKAAVLTSCKTCPCLCHLRLSLFQLFRHRHRWTSRRLR